MTAAEKWSSLWSNDIHETDDAKKRIASAKSSKLTPIKIDTADILDTLTPCLAENRSESAF